MSIELTTKEVRALEHRLRRARNANEYRRLLAVLEVARGSPVVEVARRLKVARQSVYHWIDAYRSGGGPEAVVERGAVGRPSIWTEPLLHTLRTALEQSPSEWDYRSEAWTVDLLQHHLETQTGTKPSPCSLRRQLRHLGYTWKRPRYVLEPDPLREKKTRDSPENCPFASTERGLVRG